MQINWKDPSKETPRPYAPVLIAAIKYGDYGNLGWTQGIVDRAGEWYNIVQTGNGQYDVYDTVSITAWAHFPMPENIVFGLQKTSG